MSFSNLWKGLAVVAVLFLFSLEASAQLPVRTQTVQWLNPTAPGSAFTVDFNYGAAAVTGQTMSWPQTPGLYGAAPGAAPVGGEEAILIGTWTSGTDVNLRWQESDGFVDGFGATNHVTFWSPDNNTLAAQESFEFDPATGEFRVGVDLEANPAAPDAVQAGTAGSIAVGDNTANATILLDGTTATATLGRAAAVGPPAITGVAGTIEMYDGGAEQITISTGNQTLANVPIQFDVPTAGPTAPATSFFITPARNVADATTEDYILTANDDGTAEWRLNPAALMKSGHVTMGAAGMPAGGIAIYTAAITFADAYPVGTTPVVVVTMTHPTNANILQVTAATNAGFTVTSTAPLLDDDTFNWIATTPYDPAP